jgi:hypothetical protein
MIINSGWYRAVIHKNGKPDLDAIQLLSHIVDSISESEVELADSKSNIGTLVQDHKKEIIIYLSKQEYITTFNTTWNKLEASLNKLKSLRLLDWKPETLEVETVKEFDSGVKSFYSLDTTCISLNQEELARISSSVEFYPNLKLAKKSVYLLIYNIPSTRYKTCNSYYLYYRRDNNIPFQPVISEKVNLPERILTFWNHTFRDLTKVTKHRSLDSKVSVKQNRSKYYSTYSIRELLESALSMYEVDLIEQAITNYYSILTSKKIYLWSLGRFIYAGLNKKSGFVLFLPSNFSPDRYLDTEDPKIEEIKSKFLPVTVKISGSPIDFSNKKYYGFSLDSLSKDDVKFIEEDVNINLKAGKITFGVLHDIEKIIAILIFRRKKNTDSSKLLEWFNIWYGIDKSRWQKEGK